MYEIEVTNRFLKDLKLARKRNLDENKLNDIVRLLADGKPIPEKNRDHPLVGDYKGAGNVILRRIGCSSILLKTL